MICVKHVDNGLLLLVDFKFTEIFYDENLIEDRKERILNAEESLIVLKKRFGICIIQNNDSDEYEKRIILKRLI